MNDTLLIEEAEGTAAAADPRARRLVVSRWLALEALTAEGAVIFHSATGARLQVSRALYELLRRFQQPATIAEAYGKDVTEPLLEHFGRLVDKGFLVAADVPESPRLRRRTAAVSHPLFNCPAYRPGDAVAAVSILGAPYDLASPGEAGTRRAPGAIRQRSFDFEYQVDFVTGRPKGWFDADREERILEGVTFCDRGDVVVEYGESQRDFFERLGGLVDEISGAGSLPVLLGGDHATTFPAVERLARRRPLAVLYLDAHTDFDPSIAESIVNANCVARRLWRLDGVERLVQVGHRGYTINAKAPRAPQGVEIVTAAHYRRAGSPCVLAALPADLPVYVTVDVNVLDPVFAPGTAHPTPGGFTLDEVKAILHAAGAGREVVGLDLVELHPGHDVGGITAIVACHLLLAALGAVTARGG